MRLFVLAVCILHALFMVFELLPPENPRLLHILSKNLPKEEGLSDAQLKLVAAIVQNAGIYNGIIAGGLLWSLFTADRSAAASVAQVLLVGAGVAGVFGTLTLKSPLPAIQGIAGIVGALLVASRGLG
jgi:putative membrane protein